MSRYLDKYISTIPKSQGRQIFEMLNEAKDLGAIKTVAEYNKRLQELSQVLKSTRIQPTLKWFKAMIGDLIDADRFNAMVKAVGRDLHTAFVEADNLAEILALHQFLYQRTVLRDLRKAVGELEKTISLYEFFNADDNFFSEAQFNTFNTLDGDAVQRTNAGAADLFYDYSKKEDVDSSEDAAVDSVGKRLIMPVELEETIDVADVQMIHDGDTIVPDRDLQHADMPLSNVIDGQAYTYWLYPVLLSNKQTTGVKIKLRFDLGNVRRFNTVKVMPASPYKMVLESLIYVGSDKQTHTVAVNSELEEDSMINVEEDITARFVTLVFRQDNAEPVHYHYDANRDIWTRVNKDDISPESHDQGKIDRIMEELTDEVRNSELRDILQLNVSNTYTEVDGYQYTFGLDNIVFMSHKYRRRGIFVGKALETKAAGLVGLKVTENNPTVQIGNNEYPQFSFEYYVVKFDYDSGGYLISKEIIPISPFEDNFSVDHERLYLTTAESGSAVLNAAQMRFAPNVSEQTPVVYKNLTSALTIGTDYTVEVASSGTWRSDWATVGTDLNSSSDTKPYPTPVKIKFDSTNIGDIYTISYYISDKQDHGASDPAKRKLLDYVKVAGNGIVRCNRQKGSSIVDRSVMYVTAIMRNNYLSDRVTCGIEDYKLLVNEYDSDKFGVS